MPEILLNNGAIFVYIHRNVVWRAYMSVTHITEYLFLGL